MSESTEKPQSQLLIEETVELNEIHAATNLNLVKIEASVDSQDEEVFSERAALYRFAEADNDWKERARGDVKVLMHKETGKYRLVMHAEKILKLRLNQFVGDIELKPNVGSETSWTWRWVDYATDSGEAETHSFAIRFRTKDIALKFKDVWDMARAKNYPNDGEAAPAAAEEATATASEEKKEEKKEEEKKEEEKPATE